ncbi:MAG: helix-turn-helix transcriptional regulator [Pyrobaculum sp.]
MNVTLALVLAPLAAWLFPVAVPPNATATVVAHLPPICNATGAMEIHGPAVVAIACVNRGLEPVPLSGAVSVQYSSPPPPPPLPAPEAPVAALAVGAAAAAGLSHLFSNRRELLAAPLVPIVARIKTARAQDPARTEILRLVEKMGAATLSQIVRSTGKTWGAVQWHVYVLEREGKLRSIRVGPFTYYYVNPRAAAEVILSSVDPATLSPEDREKLDLMASS